MEGIPEVKEEVEEDTLAEEEEAIRHLLTLLQNHKYIHHKAIDQNQEFRLLLSSRLAHLLVTCLHLVF